MNMNLFKTTTKTISEEIVEKSSSPVIETVEKNPFP